MTDAIGVLVVDDHAVFVQGLELVLQTQPDLTVVGSANTAADALRLAQELKPKVVLMDLRLPDGSGAEAAAKIHAVAPEIATVMLSAEAEDRAILAAVEAGAVGYLTKTQAADRVVDAVRRAAAGEILFAPSVLAGVLARHRSSGRDERERHETLERLTQRERDVLRLMAEGLDNKAIASRMGIRLNTVRGYVQGVLEKLGVHSKLEAVVRASQWGLLD